MKIPKSTLLTREIAFTSLGRIGLTQGKLAALPGLVAASSDESYDPFSEAATRPSLLKIQGRKRLI